MGLMRPLKKMNLPSEVQKLFAIFAQRAVPSGLMASRWEGVSKSSA
jgi:hypothetical protein